MTKRALRLVLVLLVVAIQGAAAWQVVIIERARAAAREAATGFDLKVRTLLITTAELRAAQQAYVAEGQGEAYWLGRATTLASTLAAGLTEARALTLSTGAVQAFDAAAVHLDTLNKLDQQARTFLKADQRLMASDLVFGDSSEAAAALMTAIDQAYQADLASRQHEEQRARAIEAACAGGAAGIALVALFLLLPQRQASPAAAPAPAEQLSAPPLPAASVAAAPEPMPDVAAVAGLCTDLSRVSSPADLPALIARAADLLGASGLIVWMADASAATLHPVLSHGYSPQVLARMDTLSVGADNATVAAYRSGQPVTLPGEEGGAGALVVPILTPTGCVGVVAAEMAGSSQVSPSRQALAVILAAQLASLVPAPRATAGSGPPA